jgi:hypothetical protein
MKRLEPLHCENAAFCASRAELVILEFPESRFIEFPYEKKKKMITVPVYA